MSNAAANDQVYLITGAAGGLGSALARELAANGSELILLDKSQRGLNALHDELESSQQRAPALYPLDMAGATEADYAELAQIIDREFGALNGLIHCAAELGQLAPYSALDLKQWQRTFTVNLHAPVVLTRELLPLLKRATQPPARIVFSIDDRASAYWGAYAASKAALSNVVATLSHELQPASDQPAQVTCNAVCPGPMRTALRVSAYPGEPPQNNPDPATKLAPYHYLLGDAGRTVNGRILHADEPSTG